MPRAHRARRILRRRLTRLALAGLAIGFSVAPQMGCGREFFRHWADQDATEAIFEKSRDPRWRLDRYTMEPPALSRSANPYNSDRQPAPPDDPATEALSPTPQLPYHRLLVPAEGTGYMDMMEKGRRYESPPPQTTVSGPGALPGALPTGPPPATGTPSPFNPSGNSGTNSPEITPNYAVPPAIPMPVGPTGPVDGTPPQARAHSRTKDNGVLLTSFQAPGLTVKSLDPSVLPSVHPGQDTPPPPPTLPQDIDRTPIRPGQRLSDTAPELDPGALPPVVRPGQNPASALPNGVNLPGRPLDTQGGRLVSPTVPLEPSGGMNTNTIAGPRADLPGGVELLQFLNPIIVLDEAQASSYPANSRPFVVGPAEALQYALMNSRAYQFNLEQVYVQALLVTAQRFGFQTNFYAGFSPSTVPTNNSIPNNPSNIFRYNTKEAIGGQTSAWNMGTAAGFGKALSFGGKLAAGFANQTAFNFLSKTPGQPSVQSFLPIAFSQAFLKGGGRAVVLEQLTQSERNLLYQVRLFARFRQEMLNVILTSGQAFDQNQGNAVDPTPGYLAILVFYQNVENDRNTIAYYERLLGLYEAYVRGGASSGISQIQVDQLSSQIQSQRGTLLTDEATLKFQLDNYKMSLGLPPDLPMILDRSTTGAFPKVFKNLVLWARRNGEPEELDGIILGLPKLESIIIDGRALFEYKGNKLEQVYAKSDRQQEFLLAVERVALENRLDLMNNRAQLYDSWRQLSVTANALKGILNISLTNQITTSPASSNPFAFIDQAKTFSLSINSELPLVRVNERNAYRLAQITYNRAERLLQSLEDDIKQLVRQDVYTLIANAENYHIAQLNLKVNLRQRDFATRQIFAPATSIDASNSANVAAQTNNLIQSIGTILNVQKQLLANWVTYQAQRLSLYADMGLLPYDEWEAYYEFFPANSATGNDASTGNNGPPVARPADAPPERRP